ncbi:MAG TPA: ABC transporter permease [Tepidiformaceae bacterium]|nr:ABC transporter permease [Tepidiformaceae bacterium]
MQYSGTTTAAGRAGTKSGTRLPLGRLRAFIGNKNNLLGTMILGPIVVLAVVAPVLPIPDPLAPDLRASLVGPSLDHPFGTDKLGRDIFSRTLSGLRVSLIVGFSAATIALTVGMVLGTIAGFMGKTVDMAVSAVVDMFLAFPSLLLAIGFIAVFGPGLWQVILAISLSDAPRAVRLQRSLALSLKTRTYIDAARMASAPTWWLLIKHVLPNTIAPMLVVGSIYAANAILAEAALSFLGLGLVPPEPSLGNLIADGREYLREAWWISTLPGLVIVIVSISLHFFSDGIRENLDPRAAGH